MDSFEVRSSVGAVLTEDEKPDDWDELTLQEQLERVSEVLSNEPSE